MKTYIFGFLVAVMVVYFVGHFKDANAISVRLDMDSDPVTDEGWDLIRPSGFGGGSRSHSGGLLTISAPSYYEIVAPSSLWQDTVDNSLGWSVETRMRRVSGSGNPGMWFNDGEHLFHAQITATGLLLTNGFTGFYALNPFEFHTYRFEGKNDSLNVFVDDSLALSLSAGISGGSFVLMFGDLNYASGVSVSEWDYFGFNTDGFEVPLPAAFPLLLTALGGLGLIGWRRKRIAPCA